MTIEKWHPLKEIESMRREMDRLWEELFPAARRPFVETPWRRQMAEKVTASPAVDIIDGGKEVVVKADMPGVAREDLNISLQENTLTMKGEVSDEKGAKEGDYYYSERSVRTFERSINIPFKINQDQIKASLKDGVLTVRIPKAEEVQPRKIKVEVE